MKKQLREIYRKARNYTYFLLGKPKGLGYIMMMHHVLPKESNKMPLDTSLNITPDALEEFIRTASSLFDLIPISEVPERIKYPKKRKFIVFTLDDGFESVYTNALPIFTKYKVPFTVFITTGFIGEECKTYHSVGKCEYAMSYKQLDVLKRNPLSTIGGHTENHSSLAELTKEDIIQEITGNIFSLKSNLQLDIETFAYPYGSVNSDVLDVILDLQGDIKIGVLATGGVINTAHSNNHLLPRVNLDDNTTAKELLFWRNVYM